jgi:hypothetical protein
MSNLIIFTNGASSLLASGILGTDTTVTVTAGEGLLFSTIASGQIGVGTLEDTSGNIEIVTITGRTTDTMTIVRAQEGTTALPFASGSRFECRFTAGIAATFFQKTGSDTISGVTTFTGIINSTGSIRGGELSGVAIRGSPAETDNQILVPSGGGAPTAGASPILTAANIVSELGSGVGVVISGMVLFWSGASNAIPAGYVLCDGTDSTPDLRDQFILGGGGALPTTGGSQTTGTAGAHTHGGATGSYTLLLADIPSHGHSGIFGDSTVNTGSIGTFMVITNNGSLDAVRTISNSGVGNSGGGGGHSHTIASDGAHQHTTLPPYRALFAIMKT